MKTTIEIAEALLASAKRIAALERATLRSLIHDGLRRTLAQRAARRAPFKLREKYRAQYEEAKQWPN